MFKSYLIIYRVHPLAGQGVNLGLRDVACLTNELNKAVYDGEYLGEQKNLCLKLKIQLLSEYSITGAFNSTQMTSHIPNY